MEERDYSNRRMLREARPPKNQIFEDFVLNRGWVGVKSPKLLMTLYNSHVYIAF